MREVFHAPSPEPEVRNRPSDAMQYGPRNPADRQRRPRTPGFLGMVLAVALMAPSVGLQAGPTTGPGVKRSEHHYALPSVRLIGTDGKPLPLGRVLDDGRPVVLTFLYTSCTTICPINSQVLTTFTELLGQEASRVNVVSVSIDPDHDTVARLTSHARRNALSGAFYTGDPAASEAVQRAFEAWRGDKMNHEAVIFLRAPGHTTWVRLDGLVSPQRLLSEYRQLVPS